MSSSARWIVVGAALAAVASIRFATRVSRLPRGSFTGAEVASAPGAVRPPPDAPDASGDRPHP